MTTQIVTVNVTQTIAPAPSQLQRTGAFVSQGATTLAAGSTHLLTQFSDLASILASSVAITSATWTTGVVTITTTVPHGIPSGDILLGTIAGISPAAYNGTFSITSAGTNTLTYALVSNPGAATVTGAVFSLEDISELVAMATTFFAQGTQNSVYVLELGVGTTAQGVTALTAYINNPTVRFYGYLLPETWSSEPTAITMAKNFDATTAQTYFWVTVTLANYTNWTNTKSVVMMVEDASAPVTEFSLAAMFWNALNYNPSDTNKVAPMAFQYLVGVTAFTGSQTVQQQLKTANCNYVGTGAEGGISNTLVLWGVTADGNDCLLYTSPSPRD